MQRGSTIAKLLVAFIRQHEKEIFYAKWENNFCLGVCLTISCPLVFMSVCIFNPYLATLNVFEANAWEVSVDILILGVFFAVV